MEEQLEEAQSFQSIGQGSPQLNDVASEAQGWGGSPPLSGPGIPVTQPVHEDPRHEQTDASDFSFRDVRANNQARGWEQGPGSSLHPPKPHLPPGASGSMAAQQVIATAKLPPTNTGGNS